MTSVVAAAAAASSSAASAADTIEGKMKALTHDLVQACTAGDTARADQLQAQIIQLKNEGNGAAAAAVDIHASDRKLFMEDAEGWYANLVQRIANDPVDKLGDLLSQLSKLCLADPGLFTRFNKSAFFVGAKSAADMFTPALFSQPQMRAAVLANFHGVFTTKINREKARIESKEADDKAREEQDKLAVANGQPVKQRRNKQPSAPKQIPTAATLARELLMVVEHRHILDVKQAKRAEDALARVQAGWPLAAEAANKPRKAKVKGKRKRNDAAAENGDEGGASSTEKTEKEKKPRGRKPKRAKKQKKQEENGDADAEDGDAEDAEDEE